MADAVVSKQTEPPLRRSKRRQVATFSLSPVMKPPEDLLKVKKESPNRVDLRKIGVESLSYQSAVDVVEDKSSRYTICGFPKGKNTNAEYAAYLSIKDEYDIFHYLCQTSPDICCADLNRFLYSWLDHILKRVIAEDICDGVAAYSFYIGPPPAPFQSDGELGYLRYIRSLDIMPADEAQRKHSMVLYRAEVRLQQLLEAKGFQIPHERPFSDVIREDAREFDQGERISRNVAAHFFVDLLKRVQVDGFSIQPSNKPATVDFPAPHPPVLKDECTLGKKMLVLEHLKRKLPRMGKAGVESKRASLFLIELFLAEQVPRCREVAYGESRVLIPGKLPPNQPLLQL